ncbi:hypothetical protein C9374_009783 [Naegleria lovaniensis]|uniref:Alpha-ketoglutarate-dependent dioxygenase AlkB-like domain-containing protein n=1 Tax=Naegleria lovaniensis TaxID=51637 RepID=A0AA88H5L1_NAELO|nr:uncharacterized protein C9374_009783 [Naegleria lovaniensis]KAG2393206.1 hypothetical protein C9374_009783 [Naegleria lovaniensis]
MNHQTSHSSSRFRDVPYQQLSGLFYIRNFISNEQGQELVSNMDGSSCRLHEKQDDHAEEDDEFMNFNDDTKLESSSLWQTEIMSRRTQQFGYHFDYFSGGLKKMNSDSEVVTNALGIPFYLQSLVERVQQEHEKLNMVQRTTSNIVHQQQYEKTLELPISQIILNEYCGPYQYIKKHVDSLHFGPVVSIVSLLQPCVMILYEASQDGLPNQDYSSNEDVNEKNETTRTSLLDVSIPIKELKTTGNRSSIVLEPNSLLILSGLARYRWKHEVISLKDYEKHGFSAKEVLGADANEELYRRISITMRSVLSTSEE